MKKFQRVCLRRQGFTLAEILIVITIIMLLSMLEFMSIRGQMAHATDARRKTDLYTLSKSFEDYYNDHGAFPAQSVVNDCGGTMNPYITSIPCDPVSREHYGYFPSVNGGYRICAKLTDTTDPAIAAINCGGDKGCGVGGGYNYCLASGVTASAVGTADEIIGTSPSGGGGGGGATSTPGGDGGGGGGTSTPIPTLNPTFHVACTNGGDCNTFVDPVGAECPITWATNCTPPGVCETPANRCAY